MEATTTLIGMDVDVYYNLHKRLWSVRDHKTRRVVAHLDGLVLSGVRFRVSAAGNARVRSEGRKNVHAFARGTVVWPASEVCHRIGVLQVTYNPFKYITFVVAGTEQPIHEARKAWLSGRSVLVDVVPSACTACEGSGCPYCGGPEADYHTACIPCRECSVSGRVAS